MIDTEKRAYARPCASRTVPSGEQELGIRQLLRKIEVDVRPRGRVHVTAQDNGGLAFFIAEPFRAYQRLRLCPAPDGRKTEMGIYDLYAMAFKVNFNPERAPARFFPPGWQSARFYRPDGIPAQDRIAVPPVMNVQARMKVKIHIELAGDELGLVDPSRPRQADVEFLQRHDIGMHSRYYFCYSHRQALPVVTDAAMDVVRHDRKSDRTGHKVKI